MSAHVEGDRASGLDATASRPTRLWWGFAAYGLVSAVHIVALAVPLERLASPTKLLLMPLLAIAVVWALRGTRIGRPARLLLLAIALSWLGDGAGIFFPSWPTVPTMLALFGLAHLAYIVLFAGMLSVRRLPLWTLVYVAWWIGLVYTLWPHLGWLEWAVAGYGVLLGITAAQAARCHPLIVIGAVLFLASDSILAFRLFLPDLMPAWTSPAVMITYCLGQGLIAAGVVVTLRRRAISR